MKGKRKLKRAHASQGQLELDLHRVGHHAGVGPFVFADFEGQAFDREGANGGGNRCCAGACLGHGDGNDHVLGHAFDAEFASHFILASTQCLDAAGSKGGLRELGGVEPGRFGQLGVGGGVANGGAGDVIFDATFFKVIQELTLTLCPRN